MMIFDVLTLFPEMFLPVIGESIIKRAIENGIIQINIINIRDFSKDKHKKADDYPYGGGPGMIMTAQPIYDAYLSITKELSYKPYTIYMSPQGSVLNQSKVKELGNLKHIIILSGHYEGVDERVIKTIVDEDAIVIPNPYDAKHPSIFRDWKNHGIVDMRKAIAYSCNIYFYALGGGYKDIEGLGIRRLKQY